MENKYNIKAKVITFIECKDNDAKEKIRMLKLNKLYDQIKDKNYALMEEDLYSFCRGSIKNIINFELTRIFKTMKESESNIQLKSDYLSILSMFDKANFDSNSDINEMFDRIIELELDYGVEIALYKEAVDYFFKTINRSYDFDLIFEKDGKTYIVEAKTGRKK